MDWQTAQDMLADMLSEPPKDTPAHEVWRRFPRGSEGGEIYSADVTGAPPDMGHPQRAEDMAAFNAIGLGTNPAGMEAFLESAPTSTRIEDRRGDTVQDMIRQLMETYSLPQPLPLARGDLSLTGLPVPEFPAPPADLHTSLGGAARRRR